MKIQILDARACTSMHAQLVDLLLDAAVHDTVHDGPHDAADGDERGGGALGFAAPVDRAAAQRYWEAVAADVRAGTRLVLAAVHEGMLIGAVQLDLSRQPCGGNQAEVEKMMVRSSCRRRGIGGVLLRAVEAEARELGRSLLFLDTEARSGAAALYHGYGYTCVDEIRGVPCIPQRTAVYYKNLFTPELA